MHLYVYVNIRAYILTHTLDAVQKSYFLLNIDRLLSLVIVYTIKFIIDERILLAPRSCTFVPNKLPIWNFKDYLLNAFIKYYLSTQYVCMYTHPHTHKCIYTFEQDGFIIWTQKKIFEFTAFLVDKYCLLVFSLSDKRPLVLSLNSEKDWF